MIATDFSDPCAHLGADECRRLARAARILANNRGLAPRLGGWLGARAERAFTLLGAGWRERVQGLVEEALWRAQDLAMLGLDPSASARPRAWLARAAGTASGAASGLVGLPGVAVDIPFSTMVILRSIAEIARAEGEEIGTAEGRRACLEVLAIGGPDAADDDAEIGYWTARLGLAALNVAAIVPRAAGALGAVLSEKILAQAAPLAGAAAGAGLNYVFIRHYQQMAAVHFVVRSVERAHPADPAVRACFEQLIADAARPGGARRRADKTFQRQLTAAAPRP